MQMTKEEAHKILTDALNLATTKGAYNLQDTSAILVALNALDPKEKKTKNI